MNIGAALNTGSALPEVKAAAERGLQRAYEPPAKPHSELSALSYQLSAF